MVHWQGKQEISIIINNVAILSRSFWVAKQNYSIFFPVNKSYTYIRENETGNLVDNGYQT